MGFFGDIGNSALEGLGLKKGDAHTVDPNMYGGYYDDAMKDLQNAGVGGANQEIRSQIENQALQQLGDLNNNAAGRKKNYLEDMSRDFEANTNSVARARGGTGTLQQALIPNGQMADANNRATSRGLLDLQGQAVTDLGKIQGLQGNFYNQDFNKAKAMADTRLGQQKLRLGQANTNSDSLSNVDNQQRNNLSSTLSGAGKMFGMG